MAGKDIDWDSIRKEFPEVDFSINADMKAGDAVLKRMMKMPTTPEEDALLAATAKRLGW